MPTVLIVDDARFSRSRLLAALKSLPVHLEEAGDGLEALERIPLVAPDVIITDLLMPRMSGLDFLAQLRITGSRIPVIVVTADIQASTQAACLALGVRAFLTKPFETQKLQVAVTAALASAVPALVS